jgi:hypothetical protein
MDQLVDTPLGKKSLHVCKDGDGENDTWVTVYEEAFPRSQRQDVAALRSLIRSGRMELDETRDQHDEIVSLTLTEVFSDSDPGFLLACYTATPPSLRSLGIGSIHRRRLVELLQQEYPRFLGLFSEIESTRESGLDESTRRTRERRLTFFLRLGVRRIPIDYRFPSFEPDHAPLEGELLWVPFGSEELAPNTLREILVRIYVDGYGLEKTDPFIDFALRKAGIDQGVKD